MHNPAVILVRSDAVVAPLRSGCTGHAFIPVHPDMMRIVPQMRTWRVDGTSLFGWRAEFDGEPESDADWVGFLPIDAGLGSTVH